MNENIKTIRKNKGMTQEEMASQLHVTRQTISKWEKGLSVPDADMLMRMAEILDVSVAELLGADRVEQQQMDAVVEQLCRINEQLAIKNRRARKIWKAVIVAVVVLVVIPLIIAIAGSVAFIASAPDEQAQGGGTAKWIGTLDGEEYIYYITYDDKFRIREYSGTFATDDEGDGSDTGSLDFSGYRDANKMAEDLEAYFDENGGELQVEIRQLVPDIYKDEF